MLEQAIAELNTNIRELIAALGATPQLATEAPPVATTAPPAAAPAPTAAFEPMKVVLTDATVLKTTFKTVIDKVGREQALALLQKEGVSRFSELPAERWGPFYAACQVALRGH
jgi:hypothetical protein